MELIGPKLRGAAVAAAATIVLSACSVFGGSDPAPTPTALPSPTAIPATATLVPTPAVVVSPTITHTPTIVRPTATPVVTPSPSPTATRTPTVTPTPTPVIPEEQPFGGVKVIDPLAIPNFTLAVDLATTGVPGGQDSTDEVDIQQHAPDNYHVRVVNDGVPIESWAVGGAFFLLQDGAVARLPEGVDGSLFAPGVFMQTTPIPDAGTLARRIGEETVAGRRANHFRLDPEDAVALVATNDALVADIQDATGNLDIWIDAEQQWLLRISGEVAWTNPDGSSGRLVYSYDVRDIGTTPEVAAPA